MKLHVFLPAALCSAIVATATLHASGGISGGSAGPRGEQRALYQLGKALYHNELPLPESPDQSLYNSQSAALASLHAQLSPEERDASNLPGLAGRLNTDQWKALLYYLEIRFRIKPGATP